MKQRKKVKALERIISAKYIIRKEKLYPYFDSREVFL
jgi:hypothetical protein